MENEPLKTEVQLHAKVFRIAWDKKPFFIPKSVWMFLGKRRFPGTVRMEDVGMIASSKDGTAQVEIRN